MECKETAKYLSVQFGAGGKKWTTLEHNGVWFPPPYVSHGVPLMYDGKEIILDPNAEEIGTLYAKFIETDYVKERIFRKNFWGDWKEYLGDTEIEDFDKCDFSLIYNHLLKVKEQKKIEGKESEDVEKYKVAIIDGKEQPVGNFRMEPPGIFLGRGCNPKLGKVKRRIFPEDIIINIGKEAKVPEMPDFMAGHSWGEIIHNKYVEWLASWKDDITGKTKYVWLGAQSALKAKSDIEKFDLARKLKRKIRGIREKNEEWMRGGDKKMRQVATALYFIDKYALRVGNEKGEDDTDTVGVTSLRVEHVNLLDGHKIKLDFLGKDSVRYNKILGVEEVVYNNVKEFMTGKEGNNELFDLISSSDINDYLKSFMKHLTAKVFRTYNASNLFQKELGKISAKYETYDADDKVNILLDEFNKANGKVALLCNHQKNITKGNVKQIEGLNGRIKKLKTQIRSAKKRGNIEKVEELRGKMKKVKAKKEMKIELKNISLGTSKVNYIDPRITVAFMKKHGLPIDKIFPKTLQEKFSWAFGVGEGYRF